MVKSGKAGGNRRSRSLEVKQRRMGYVFVAPLIVGMLVFVAFPVIQSLFFSFSKLSVTASGYRLSFLGGENYRYLFAVDPEFRQIVLASLRDMLINVPVVVLFSFFVASLLNQRFRGRSIVRAILFLPVIIASGVVESVDQGDQFSSLIAAGTQAGGGSAVGEQLSEKLIEYLQQLNISPQITDFVIDTVSRVYEIAVLSAVPVIIFLARLQSVPSSLFESSYMEGASKWEVFWKISLPMVSPLILVAVIYCIIDSFTNVSNPVISRIHSSAYDSLNFGLSSAMAWSYMLLILLVLGIVYKLVSRHIVYHE